MANPRARYGALPRVVSIALCLAALPREAGATQAAGGTIEGQVIDDRTGKPLAGVFVQIEGRSAGVETDREGRFALAVEAGRHVLQIALIGYALNRRELEVAPGARLAIVVALAEGAGTYKEELTVTAARDAAPTDAPSAGTLHGRELQNLRGVALDDPLRAVHALPASTATDDFYSEFAVRGSPFRHIALTIDGVPSRYLMHTVQLTTNTGSIAMVNSETLGAVSLFPGSYAQRAGRALGAHVALVTREGARDRVKGRAGLSGTNANVLVEGPFARGRGSWLASARRSYLDYLIRRIDPDADFAFGFTDAQAKVVYDLTPRHQVHATTLVGLAIYDDSLEALSANDEDVARSTSWLTTAGWRYIPGPRIALHHRLYVTGVRFGNENPAGVVLDGGRSVDAGWRMDGSYAPAAAWLLEFGGDLARFTQRRERRRFIAPDSEPVGTAHRERSRAAGVYAQARWTITPRVAATPGARIDHWGLNGTLKLSPWGRIEIAPTERIRVIGGGGIYRQFPDLEHAFGVRAGGPGLRRERAVHADLALDATLPRDVSLQLAGYLRQENGVLWSPGAEPRRLPDGSIRPGDGDAPWVNGLDGRARGVELLLRRSAPAGVSGWAGYAFSRHRYTNVPTGERFWSDVDQRHTIAIYAHYRRSYRASAGAKFRYGSNYPIAGYIGRGPAPYSTLPGEAPGEYHLTDRRNELRLPPYARLDLRADRTFTWSRRRVTVFVEVANVLNRRNVRNAFYRTNASGAVAGVTESLMPILPSAGFIVEF